MAHPLRYLIVTLVVVAFAAAAGPPAETTVRFTVFSARPIPGLVFAPRVDSAAQKVVFYPTSRSPRYDYRGAMPLRFLDAAGGKVVAAALIPPGISDALLIFTSSATAAGGGVDYQIAVLDDGLARNGPGGLAIVNFSGLELSGTVGRHAVILGPGLNPTLPIGRSAKIALRAAFKGKTYQSCADQVELGPSERALLVLFPPYYAGSLEAQWRILLDESPAPPIPAARR